MSNRRTWTWPVAIVALFLCLFAGSVWLVRVAQRVGEVPMETHAQPPARVGVRQ